MSKKIDIVRQYVGNYTGSFSGRELARKLGINHQTTLNCLQELVKEKILTFRVEGRNNNYFLKLDSFNTRLWLQLAENANSLCKLKNYELKKVVEAIVPLTEIVIVFGSFAKSLEKEDSDIDLIIISGTNKKVITQKLSLFSREINAEFISWSDFVKSYHEKSALAKEIVANHLLFGNVYKVVDLYCN